MSSPFLLAATAATIWITALTGAACSTAAPPQSKLGRDSLHVDGKLRTYLLYTPTSLQASSPAPLVLIFHGGFGSGADLAPRIGMNAVADRAGFIAVYPDALNKHWNDGRETTAAGADDVAFIRALIGHLRSKRAIDARRIYAAGLSNGGYFTLRLACESTDLFAAVAPVISTFPEPLHARCRPSRTLPLLLIAGIADPLVPWSGGELTRGPQLGGKGGKVISVHDTIEFWRRHNGCSSDAREIALPDRDPDDGTRVLQTQFGSCRDGADVMLLAVEGGGHTWPGAPERPKIKRLVGRTTRDIDASEMIWEFFSRYPSPTPPEPATSSNGR